MWSLANSKLIQHCRHLQVDQIWNNLIRKENYVRYENEKKRDAKRVEIKCNLQPNAGKGVFCLVDLEKNTQVGWEYTQYINDSTCFELSMNFKNVEEVEQAIQQYEKQSLTDCNAENVLFRNSTTGDYTLTVRLLQSLPKGREILLHYFVVQWIVTEWLQPIAITAKQLSLEQCQILEQVCIEKIGKSQKKGLLIWAIFQDTEFEKNKKPRLYPLFVSFCEKILSFPFDASSSTKKKPFKESLQTTKDRIVIV